MLVLMTAGAVLGALLAMWFKVWVLTAAISIGAVVVSASGIANGDSIWSILLGLGAFTISLQFGYFAGLYALVSLTCRAERHNPTAENEPVRRKRIEQAAKAAQDSEIRAELQRQQLEGGVRLLADASAAPQAIAARRPPHS